MKNEALRLFLAVTALLITALLTNPETKTSEGPSASYARVKKPAATKPAGKSRNIAFNLKR